MKKILLNDLRGLISCAFTVAMLSVTACNSVPQEENGVQVNGMTIPALLERKSVSGPETEAQTVRTVYNDAVKKLQDNPGDQKQYISIATAYITEGRVTGNNGYYSNAAMKVLKHVTDQPDNKDLEFQALSYEATVLLNMHQFKDALEAAQKAVAINSYNAAIWGALVDANVELGNYDEAVKACDKMLSIRPDLRSYSRASYLRQIYGDNNGAIDAMKMAVEAGVPGDESTEWARVTLGDLYLNTGNADKAVFCYQQALAYRPGYAHANVGMARAEKARKNYDAAIEHTETAIRTMSESAFIASLADLYELKGNRTKAAEIRADVVKLLEDGEKEQPKDAVIKHNANRELAMAYMNAGDNAKALEYAKNDLAMRPANIDANELAAWLYYKNGDMANAKTHAALMLKTGSKNANTLYKASVIYAAAGEQDKANEYRMAAKSISPYIDQHLLLASN